MQEKPVLYTGRRHKQANTNGRVPAQPPQFFDDLESLAPFVTVKFFYIKKKPDLICLPQIVSVFYIFGKLIGGKVEKTGLINTL